VYSGPQESRDFDQSEWDKKVLSILGHYALLSVHNAARQQALQAEQEQRAVAEAFAAVGDIASNLMHRLNNKIGTIPVRVEGIQDKRQAGLAQDAYLAKNLEEIRDSAAAAMEIMQETLFHLRPIQFSLVRIADCVRQALASTQVPPGVQVDLHGLDSLPEVYAGASRLALAFVNLLENAVDAMHGQGRIEIRGEAREKWIEIRVADSGPGIPPELHERIFEFNYSTRAPETPGKLGFGLWWVKTLMARFGGRVWVESDGRSGSTFVLELPRTEAAP
jgi:signal transduction histidine kinase